MLHSCSGCAHCSPPSTLRSIFPVFFVTIVLSNSCHSLLFASSISLASYMLPKTFKIVKHNIIKAILLVMVWLPSLSRTYNLCNPSWNNNKNCMNNISTCTPLIEYLTILNRLHVWECNYNTSKPL